MRSVIEIAPPRRAAGPHITLQIQFAAATPLPPPRQPSKIAPATSLSAYLSAYGACPGQPRAHRPVSSPPAKPIGFAGDGRDEPVHDGQGDSFIVPPCLNQGCCAALVPQARRSSLSQELLLPPERAAPSPH